VGQELVILKSKTLQETCFLKNLFLANLNTELEEMSHVLCFQEIFILHLHFLKEQIYSLYVCHPSVMHWSPRNKENWLPFMQTFNTSTAVKELEISQNYFL